MLYDVSIKYKIFACCYTVLFRNKLFLFKIKLILLSYESIILGLEVHYVKVLGTYHKKLDLLYTLFHITVKLQSISGKRVYLIYCEKKLSFFFWKISR